nr:secoisolariciresinol dehydrogenase-like [Ipomoea batatas]
MASGSTAPKRLDGRVAIITGGVGGIGSCIAKLFCEHGAKVILADTRDDESQSICKDLGPENACFVHCDVASESDVENAVNTAVSMHGRLDIMVNNAGIVGAKVSDIVDCDAADFINVQCFASTPSARGCPHAYTCSKHAIVGLTKNTALDLGRYGIRVNCVSPHAVPTRMSKTYLGLGEEDKFDVYSDLKGVEVRPEDVADAFLYLASDESRYVNGHNLLVDGGFTVSNSGLSLYSQ